MAQSVQVGDNLKNIVSKLLQAQQNVGEALTIYAGVFEELCNSGYEGKGVEALNAYYSFICSHLQSLSELYVKIATYIDYIYEEMNSFDDALAESISAGFSMLKTGGEK